MPFRIGSEFLVNTGNTFATQATPDIAGTADGGFVVAWRSVFGRDPDELDIEIQARALLPGQAIAEEFRVNTITMDAQFSPTVTARPDGSFAVAYSSGEENRLPGTSVNTQYLDADGVPTGPEHLTDYDYYHRNPEIASFPDGGVVTVWSGEFTGEGEARSPRAQFGPPSPMAGTAALRPRRWLLSPTPASLLPGTATGTRSTPWRAASPPFTARSASAMDWAPPHSRLARR